MEPELQTFLDRLAEVLEVPSIGPADDFRAVPMWSSLVGFSVLVMLEQSYGRRVEMSAFMSARTVRDLAKLAGVAD